MAERREREARLAEDQRRLHEEIAQKHRVVPIGLPGREDLSAFEVMMAADDYTTVRDELGNPRPNFLEEELMAGQRAQAEAREKARLAKEMKDDLS